MSPGFFQPGLDRPMTTKSPSFHVFQSVNSGFEGTITGLGAIPGDPTPSLVVAVTRFYGLLTNAGETQIIMTIPE